MTKTSGWFVVGLFAAILPAQCLAHSYGPPPRVTGGTGDKAQACTLCHGGSALNSGTGNVKILLQSGPVYIPGVKQRIAVQVSDPTQQRWGFELSARLNTNLAAGQAGDFTPVDNFTQVICEDASAKPCPTGPSFIEHTSAGTRNGTKGGATFQFDWTPPAAGAGAVTFFVAGNAANGNGASSGDLIYTSSIQLNPVTPVAPVVPSGNMISAATSLAGPVAANSWVAIYGSNLGVTTRAWNDTDIVNGAMPVSLDGVSVVLTAFGAPRLASIGYVSPNQVNFLLPSDASATTYQVQLKNPAGITAQLPLVVQANTPQLLTLDGKFVAATHSDGTLLGKSGAVPGETVTLYGTGCGAVTPALVPGQIPTVAAGLVTLPQASIGGSSATVVSGGVVPGTGGLYELRVTVPTGAANGDLPVSVQLGANTSVPALITIQKSNAGQ